MTNKHTKHPSAEGSMPAMSRRTVLKGASAIGAASLFTSVGPSSLMSVLASQTSEMGLNVPLVRGLYQDNGATPWYANLQLGTPAQNLKFALDTGSNFVWVTSTLCQENDNECRHTGGAAFDYNKSGSFVWCDRLPKDVGFGPWGEMTVETGADTFGISGKKLNASFYLAENYAGPNFSELDWDGGIGFPSSAQYVDPSTTFIMQELMRTRAFDAAYPFLSFSTDYATKQGTCLIGGVDNKAYDPFSGIFLPWEAFTGLGGAAKYLWTSPLRKYSVGSQTLARDITFCLDSGSSQFKGDLDLIKKSLGIINGSSVKPDITLDLGHTPFLRQPGQVVITPDMYEVKLEAGRNAGQTLPQFETDLNIPALMLVGSILMDSVYSIFEYKVVGSSDPRVASLDPVGIWLFNKVGGPNVIRSRSDKPVVLGPRNIVPETGL